MSRATARETSTAAWSSLAFGSLVQVVLLGGFFLIPFAHLWGTVPENPTAGGPSADGGPSWATVVVAIVFGLPTLVPFCLLRERRSVQIGTSALLTVSALCLVLLPNLVALATYPCCASDVLDYVNRQRLWSVYGENPFAVVPNAHPDDWSYGFAQFRDSVFGYGPLWWLIARAFTLFAVTLDHYLLGFKLLAAVCFGASLGLIWRLSPPERRLANAIFFAWNPVVLLDGTLRLHNDLLTVPFLLLAIVLARSRSALALPSVALAAFIKVIVAPVGLVIVADLVRFTRWRPLALGLVLSGAVTVALYLPFWYGPGTLAPLLVQANRAQWSIGAALLSVVGPPLGSAAMPLVRLVMLGTGLVFLAVMAVRQARTADDPAHRASTLAGYAAISLLIGMLTTPLAFYSHYLTPVIGLAAVSAHHRLRVFLLALSFGTMVNTILGISQFAGGPGGATLDTVGTVVLLTSLLVGLLRWRSTAASGPAVRASV